MVCLKYCLVKLFFSYCIVCISMFVVFATMFLGKKKIIIRPNFYCSRLFKLFFLFQLFIVLYFCCMYDFLLPLCGEIKITNFNKPNRCKIVIFSNKITK